ncbi:methylmalonyl-CoA epimerase, partial [Candidatus Sumerlaeota bacterium]|nr:methylmalonyl-CoA epimerase [Candidatus Sumerlaeota bacterium]
MFTRIDHIGVAVRNIEEALATLRKTGGIVVGKEELIPSNQVKAVMVAAGDAPIELIQPTSPESTVAAFLEKRGEGLHHVAYRVANIDAALKECETQGFKLIDKVPRHGYAESRVAFLHPKGMFGVLTELVERKAGHDIPPY